VIRRLLKRLVSSWERFRYSPLERYRRKGLKAPAHVPVFAATIAEPHLTEIGENVWLTAGTHLLNHDGAIAMLNRAGRTDLVNLVGKIVIEDNVFVGIRSIIMPGVRIGTGSIVATGSLVTKDVEPNTVVGGIPARFICNVDDYISGYDAPEMVLEVEKEAAIKQAVSEWASNPTKRKIAIRLREGKTRLTR
jgi:carbonic anhydrase/acetyltransferase-like protein (isoleucine patch superfamily)